ncbi:Mur ligase domain-containing protein [Desulfovibrio sp. OttesenSCG-928-C06]|nr:Mur ligase domain-containing protein [Desulfovibrio sp. OttesenSCG-928-C06]
MLTLREMSLYLGSNPANHLPEDLYGREVASFCLDSRQAGPGDVFVCIKGENSDGHDYAAQAAANGALAIIAERDPFNGETPPLAVIRVENSQEAVTSLAGWWRDRAAGNGVKVVGVTGTAGKTSVKEVLSAVLAVRGQTCKNFLNMNNQLGLPISMLNASEHADFWVMEAGISEARDMDELGSLLRPDLALILNVGQGHLSGLGDKGVSYYKARLLSYVTPDGKALVNADYPDLVRESKAHNITPAYFSTRRSDADFFVEYLGPAAQDSTVPRASGSYRVHVLEGGRESLSFEVAAPFRGAFGAENVAAIAGTALLLGLTPEEIQKGLPDAALPRQRFSCQSFRDTVLIDDCYNANPLSAGRMLESAAEMAKEKKLGLFLVMGEMLELGEAAAESHFQLGRQMAQSGAAQVIWKGGMSAQVRGGLEQEGFGGEFVPVSSDEEFLAAVKNGYAKSMAGVLLFKGSRGNRLERFVSAFRQEYTDEQR